MMHNTDGTELSFLHAERSQLEPSLFDLDRYFPGKFFWKWAWVDRYDLTERQYAELEAKGWQPMPLNNTPSLFLPLSSQLFEILGVCRREHPQTGDPLQDFTLWARRRDCQQAQDAPVVLVAEMEQRRTTESELAKLVPGSQALLFTGSDLIYRYTLHDLGAQGRVLWECIQNGLRKEHVTFTNHQNGILLPSAERQRRAQEYMRQVQRFLERYERGLRAAAELAQCYWHHHCTTPNQPIRLPRTLADIPPGFRQAIGDVYPIPPTLGLEAVLLALSNAASGAASWQEEEHQPTYHLVRKAGEVAVTIPKAAVKAQNPQDMARQLRERVNEIDDLDGDVLLAFIIHALLVGPDERGGIWITATDILDYRGMLQKQHTTATPGVMRDAGHRPEDIKKVAERIAHLRTIHTTVRVWREPKKRGGRRRAVGLESYLFTISDFLEDRTEEEDPALPRQQIAWYYRLGDVFGSRTFWKRENAAWLLKKALRYDPIRRAWEKRLARYFLFHLRLNDAFGGATMQRSIRSILQENSLPLNEGDPEKTKTRLEQALSRLKEDGHIDSWSEEEYRKAMAKLPAHHWLAQWLEHEVEITAGPELRARAEQALEDWEWRQLPSNEMEEP